jgi:hypothetical protein
MPHQFIPLPLEAEEDRRAAAAAAASSSALRSAQPPAQLRVPLRLSALLPAFTSPQGCDWNSGCISRSPSSSTRIFFLPQILVFQLGRFEDMGGGFIKKIDAVVTFDMVLDASILLSPLQGEQGGVMYDLVGYILHRGSYASGHYRSKSLYTGGNGPSVSLLLPTHFPQRVANFACSQ